jgi:glycosyltransferase involved in cell wall biosynthesis
MNTAVSIVLTTYNGSGFLTQSVEGCLNQSLVEWEQIIVDHALTDDSPCIVVACVTKQEKTGGVSRPPAENGAYTT